MPTYDYHCLGCGKTVEMVAPIDSYPVMPCDCGGSLIRQFSPPKSKPILDIEPYIDENIDKNGKPTWVKSRQHKAQLLKENGLAMYNSISTYK